jgi:hypothetical protein
VQAEIPLGSNGILILFNYFMVLQAPLFACLFVLDALYWGWRLVTAYGVPGPKSIKAETPERFGWSQASHAMSGHHGLKWSVKRR